jgi:protein-disulfide isomerase
VRETAVLPAEAALAADAQGKFWEMHDLMLAHQDQLTRDGLLALGERAGLDGAALRSALDRHTYAAAVEADKATAAELKIDAAPAFVINGRLVGGNQAQTLRELIELALTESS